MNSNGMNTVRELKTSCTARDFYGRISTACAAATSAEPLLADDEELTSFLDRAQVQESVSVRNVLKARRLATALISDAGEFLLDKIPECIRLFRANLYDLGKDRHHDIVRDTHILKMLEKLAEDKELVRLIKNMSRPYSNKLAEDVIRDTLVMGINEVVTDTHVRRACLTALFTYLRQSLGSCFATAPAIMIQTEYPSRFLRDLDEMMNTGRLKKTFEGSEYSVPMSSSWGNGDLKKPILLLRKATSIWQSPGLIRACEAVSIVPQGVSLSEGAKKLAEYASETLKEHKWFDDFLITNAEELLRWMLLHKWNITQKTLDEYLNKPKSMMTGGLMMFVPKAGKLSGNAGDPCASFMKDLETAKRAFKMLADCALLKSWEFTLASFSEIKLEFARFNLYTSLGVNYDDPGGIGECIYAVVSRKIEQANAFLSEMKEKYDVLSDQMRYLETRLRQASTENEMQWVKMEYQTQRAEMVNIEAMHRDAHDKASKIAHLHEFLINTYDKKFFDYFQEVYDPEIHDIAQGPFDDSPAGFRLLYKYGRTNPSTWTRIFSAAEFVEALVSFFTITEQEILASDEIKGIESEMTHIITDLVNHVRSDAFLESALIRMARAHGTRIVEHPLQHLDQVEKKPWVYTSGGSMSTLVSAYFRRSDKPFETERWVESEEELFAFLLDTIKSVPAPELQRYYKNADAVMLMHSPTHAFLLKPGYSTMSAGWQTDLYIYSWIKKAYIEKSQSVLQRIFIDEVSGKWLIDEMSSTIPENFRPRYNELFARMPYRLELTQWREYVVGRIHTDRGMYHHGRPIIDEGAVDALLYTHVPFTESSKVATILTEGAQELFAQEPPVRAQFRALIDDLIRPPFASDVVSAAQLRHIFLSIAILAMKKTRCHRNLLAEVSSFLRIRGLQLPEPAIFADTNWIKDYFAFVVNPGTAQLELWSVDYLGLNGAPITSWKQWVNGSQKSPKWGIFARPSEYS